MIHPAALEALRAASDLLGNDHRFVVIGATVPLVLIDFRQNATGRGRVTFDIDVVISAQSWREFEALKARLIAAGFRQANIPHRLYYGQASIDLIPYSEVLAPGEDRAMSALGFAEAFESAQPERIGDLVISMVPVAGCVLLKFIAYNDRPAERARDLADIVYCFEHYEEQPGGVRHDAVGVEVDAIAVAYDEAGAFVLGREVAKLARPRSLLVIRKVLNAIEDEYSQPIHQILTEERNLQDDRRRLLFRLFRVFSAGVG